MAESVYERHRRWRLGELLGKYPGLRVVPSDADGLTLVGDLHFRARGPDGNEIEDSYAVELFVPDDYPRAFPSARECRGRVPADYHKLDDGSLCLGPPTELRLRLTRSPNLFTLVEGFVIPYLYGFSFFERHGRMPFGELAHGEAGIRDNLAELFGVNSGPGVLEFLRLTGMKRRRANKHPCPCRSGRRLGRCHHRRVNHLRDVLGRAWFREEYDLLAGPKDSAMAKVYPKPTRPKLSWLARPARGQRVAPGDPPHPRERPLTS